MRTCPFHLCGEQLPDHLFACKKHWRSISRPDQVCIFAAYGDYLDDKIGMEDLRRIQQEVLGTRGTA